ncbi:MAG: hypothetical protein Q8P71_00745 [bacterium]|nr:hypothetical protein [bacterium]
MDQELSTEVSLKKRKIIAIITLGTGILGLASPIMFFFGTSFVMAFYVALGFFLRGVAGVVGGIGLWKGERWGYWAAIVMWLYLIVASLINLSYLFFDGITDIHIQLLLDEAFKMQLIAKSTGRLIFGIPIVAVLGADLWRTRKVFFQKIALAKPVVVLMLVLLVGGTALGAWSILSKPTTQKPEPVSEQYLQEVEEKTKGWKTYQSEDYGVAFKYPPELDLLPREEGGDSLRAFGLETLADFTWLADNTKDTALSVKLDFDSAKDASAMLAEIFKFEVITEQIRGRTFYKVDLSSEEDPDAFFTQFYTDFPFIEYTSLSFLMYFDERMPDTGMSPQEIAETILSSLEELP